MNKTQPSPVQELNKLSISDSRYLCLILSIFSPVTAHDTSNAAVPSGNNGPGPGVSKFYGNKACRCVVLAWASLSQRFLHYSPVKDSVVAAVRWRSWCSEDVATSRKLSAPPFPQLFAFFLPLPSIRRRRPSLHGGLCDGDDGTKAGEVWKFFLRAPVSGPHDALSFLSPKEGPKLKPAPGFRLRFSNFRKLFARVSQQREREVFGALRPGNFSRADISSWASDGFEFHEKALNSAFMSSMPISMGKGIKLVWWIFQTRTRGGELTG